MNWFTFMQAPTFTIATNAGFDGALVIGKLLEQDDQNLGHDAVKGLYFTSSSPGWFQSTKKINLSACTVG